MDWLNSLIFPLNEPGVAASLILLFVVMFTGTLLGKVKIAGVSLGISGIVFTGILFGHFGYKLHPETQEFMRDFGLILFVYAIGMQVGPSFFTRLKQDGLLFNFIALITVFSGAGITWLFYAGGFYSMDTLVGMMAGAVTNTPSLGAAKAALKDIAQGLPDRVFQDPTNAYAITYPFGIIGIILAMILSGKLLGIKVEKEIEDYHQEVRKRYPAPEVRKCRVTNQQWVGASLSDFFREYPFQIIVSRLKHSGSVVVESPEMNYKLRERDVLMLVGLPVDLDRMISILGYESSDNLIESNEITSAKTFIVTRKEVINKTIGQLNFLGHYNSKATRVFRTGLELLADSELVLHYGDKIRVVGPEKELERMQKLFGNSEKRLQQPQFLSIFVGIILGVLIGSVPFLLPGLSVPVKLGMAAGPLLVAILISRFGGISTLYSYLQQSALHFMKDFGISLFFASIGIHAGESFVETFIQYQGWYWVLIGLLITFVPVFILVLVARFGFKLNFLAILGLISGSHTDPAALDFSISYYKSELPMQAYASVYPIVTVLRIVVAQLLILYALG